MISYAVYFSIYKLMGIFDSIENCLLYLAKIIKKRGYCGHQFYIKEYHNDCIKKKWMYISEYFDSTSDFSIEKTKLDEQTVFSEE